MAHRIAPRVEIDLDDIWLYVAKESGSIETANYLIDTIAARFLVIGNFPRIGRSRHANFGPAFSNRRMLLKSVPVSNTR
jgi:plasmid stabilization system protein ParE